MERKSEKVINIFDFIKKEYIAKGINMKKAAELIGTTYKNICYAKKRGNLIKGKYKIEDAGEVVIIEPEIEKEFTSYANDFTERWNDTMKAADMIEKGTGKIKRVYVKGKYVLRTVPV